MFGGKDSRSNQSAPVPQETRRSSQKADNLTAFLGPDTEIEGTLRFQHSVLIEGRFQGEIDGDGTLIIGDGANVEAQIRANSITIKGTVRGGIEATERVQIQGRATVFGEVITPSLQMDDTVTFEGSCRMGGKAVTSKTATTPKASTASPIDTTPTTKSGFKDSATEETIVDAVHTVVNKS